MQEDRLVIILADISGYTRFMVENRDSAVHGQLCINQLIESLLEHVDIPLTLQEIEGDAVFLYARDPGSESGWQATLEDVARKLPRFFDAFLTSAGATTESTPCGCAICRNSDQLGLKIVVHTGTAVFHDLAGKAQVSGPDVILAHRLLKNTISSDTYLLLTQSAFDRLGERLPGDFEARAETYEGFGRVDVRVRCLDEEFLAARDRVYALSDAERSELTTTYLDWIQSSLPKAALQQARDPIRAFGWLERLRMLFDATVGIRLARRQLQTEIPKAQRARGRRRTEWTGRPAT